MSISVIIPTYNRPEQLINLLEQLDHGSVMPDEVVIINNCSDLIYPNIKLKNIRPRVIFNSVNVGGVGNVLKCFEEAKSQWMWIIGDDDGVKLDSIEIIRGDIDLYKEAATIFYSNYMSPIAKSFLIEKTSDFLKVFDKEKFGGRLWISSAIYNRKYLKNSIQKMYEFPGSSPQMTWQLINSNKCCYFSSREIATHNAPSENELWNVLKIQNQMTQLLMIPDLDSEVRGKLADALSNWYTGHDETLIRCCMDYLINKEKPNKESIIFAYACRYVVAFLAMNKFTAAIEVIKLYQTISNDENLIYELAQDYFKKDLKILSNKSFLE